MDAPAEPAVAALNYARAGDERNLPATTPASLRSAATELRRLTALSGACVLTSFFALGGTVLATAAHTLAFATTIALAVRAGGRLRAAGLTGDACLGLDLVAGVGLLTLGAAPAVALALGPAEAHAQRWAVGVAFALMAASTYRHVLLHDALAAALRGLRATPARPDPRSLGRFKFGVELPWLACCAAPWFLPAELREWTVFPALGAFVGCFAFFATWLTALACHADVASAADFADFRDSLQR